MIERGHTEFRAGESIDSSEKYIARQTGMEQFYTYFSNGKRMFSRSVYVDGCVERVLENSGSYGEGFSDDNPDWFQ